MFSEACRQCRDQASPDAEAGWPVIPAGLGIGKTTCAKLWCSMLPKGPDHPGVLVVVRTKHQADEYAREINAWAGRPVAFAHHSGLDVKTRKDLDALPTYPVLVVRHRSYENGLDGFSVDASRVKFEKMHRWRGGKRAIVIIDEALDQVVEARIPRDTTTELMTAVRTARKLCTHNLVPHHRHAG
jgi:hypothetical protein